MSDDPKEAERLAFISEVQRLRDELEYLPNQELMMLGLAEIIAYMPKPAAAGATREALWRELWRRGSGRPSIRRA